MTKKDTLGTRPTKKDIEEMKKNLRIVLGLMSDEDQAAMYLITGVYWDLKTLDSLTSITKDIVCKDFILKVKMSVERKV